MADFEQASNQEDGEHSSGRPPLNQKFSTANTPLPASMSPSISQVGLSKHVSEPELLSRSGFLRRPPVYIEEDTMHSLDHFLVPNHYKGTLQSIMIPKGLIIDRIEKLARDIRTDYHDTTIHLLCVLKGGSAYFQELLQALRRFHDYNDQKYVPFTYDFIRVKSYHNTASTGDVQISGGDVSRLAGKNILLVEDIIDTGLTMTRLLPVLEGHGAQSVRVSSLLEKRTPRSCGFKADYVGFSIPDKFVVGFCLDYNEFYRDMNHICVINQEGIDRFKL